MEYFEYYIDGKKVSESDFKKGLYNTAEYIAKENGIFDDYINARIPQNEYDDFIKNSFERLSNEVDEKDVFYSKHKFEKIKVYKY